MLGFIETNRGWVNPRFVAKIHRGRYSSSLFDADGNELGEAPLLEESYLAGTLVAAAAGTFVTVVYPQVKAECEHPEPYICRSPVVAWRIDGEIGHPILADSEDGGTILIEAADGELIDPWNRRYSNLEEAVSIIQAEADEKANCGLK